MKFKHILQLDITGIPYKWVTFQTATILYARDKIAWTIGKNNYKIMGGIQRITGNRSFFILDSIISVKDDKPKKNKNYLFSVPRPDLLTIFKRDKFICAYCNEKHSKEFLTQDHIIPQSLNGPNTWENLITSCKYCNNKKSDRTLEESDMKLSYLPYKPCRAEYLILKNNYILNEQYEFLINNVPKNSRLF